MTLPEGWREVRLEDLATSSRAIMDGPFGSNLASQHYTDAGPRVVRLQNIGVGQFIDARAHITQEHFSTLRKHEVRAGDLLIASLGDPTLRACLAPEWLGDAIVKADCIRVRLDSTVHPAWVLYAMELEETKRWATSRSHGVGRTRLGLKVIRAIPIALPPFDEQRRIVEILEEYLFRIDAAGRSAEHAALRSDRLISATLEWDDRLRDGPTAYLGEVLATPLRNGRSVKDREGGFPVLRLTSITKGSFDPDAHKEGDWGEKEAQPFLVHTGDFLCARGNGSRALVGRGVVVEALSRDVAFPDTMIRIRPDSTRVDTAYFDTIWDSGPTRRQIEARARTTAGIYKVSQGDLKTIEIPLPPLSAQQDIARRVKQSVVAVSAVVEQRTRLARRSAALRRALLQAAFSGQLTGRVSDLDHAEELIS